MEPVRIRSQFQRALQNCRAGARPQSSIQQRPRPIRHHFRGIKIVFRSETIAGRASAIRRVKTERSWFQLRHRQAAIRHASFSENTCSAPPTTATVTSPCASFSAVAMDCSSRAATRAASSATPRSRLRRGVRQPRPAGVLRHWRRGGRDRPAGGELALQQVPQSGLRRGGAAVLHLNGYKIANPTVLARIPEASCSRCWRATAMIRSSSRVMTRRRCTG